MELVAPPVSMLPTAPPAPASMAGAVTAFDGDARMVARGAGDVWDEVRALTRDWRRIEDPEARAAALDEVASLIAQRVVGVNPTTQVVSFSGGQQRLWRGMFYRDAIYLSEDVSEGLWQALAARNPLGVFRKEAARYNDLRTLLHEGLHSTSIGRTSQSVYRTFGDQFLEEGLIELKTRRLLAAVVYHGVSPAARRAAASRLARVFGKQPYDWFVDQFAWYEQRVGANALSSLRGKEFAVREAMIASRLRPMVATFLTTHYPETAEQALTYLRLASDRAMARGLSTSLWRQFMENPGTVTPKQVPYLIRDILRIDVPIDLEDLIG